MRPDKEKKPCIKVVGVGSAGCAAVRKNIASGLPGVEIMCASTDMYDLAGTDTPFKIQLGKILTGGLGAGASVDKGRNAAFESEPDIRSALAGADIVFLLAGLGKEGTGTGAAPVIARIAKELGIMTVCVVTTPFIIEGRFASRAARKSLKLLRLCADYVIVVSNESFMEDEKIDSQSKSQMTFKALLEKSDECVHNIVKGFCNAILVGSMDAFEFAKKQSQNCTIVYTNAQNYLGVMYADGLGVPKDNAKATEWFQKAAGQGHPAACFNLAYAYEEGDGVPQNIPKALELYQRAAELGDVDAMHACAWFYENGYGVSQDDDMALKYYLMAANLGDEDALSITEAVPLPLPPIPGTVNIQPLTSASMLREEGKMLHHCVARYAGAVRVGECYLYRMLEPVRATVEIRQTGAGQTWEVHQIKSYCNVNPAPCALKAAQEWLEPYNQSLLRNTLQADSTSVATVQSPLDLGGACKSKAAPYE